MFKKHSFIIMLKTDPEYFMELIFIFVFIYKCFTVNFLNASVLKKKNIYIYIYILLSNADHLSVCLHLLFGSLGSFSLD